MLKFAGEIYENAYRGIIRSPSIYLWLILMGFIQGLAVILISSLGSAMLVSSIVTTDSLEISNAAPFIIFRTFLGVIAVTTGILGSALKSGLLHFGVMVRRNGVATSKDFLDGIFKFTGRIFLGMIIVGMLMLIPALLLLNYYQDLFQSLSSDIFLSGWNFGQAMHIFGLIVGMFLIAGVFQVLVYFWISLWDEMLIFYDLSVPDALLGAFTFVFSKNNFGKVITILLINCAVTQTVIVATNFGTFNSILYMGAPAAWVASLVSAASNPITSLIQFIMLPLYAYALIYLLPAANPVKQEIPATNAIETEYNAQSVIPLK